LSIKERKKFCYKRDRECTRKRGIGKVLLIKRLHNFTTSRFHNQPGGLCRGFLSEKKQGKKEEDKKEKKSVLMSTEYSQGKQKRNCCHLGEVGVDKIGVKREKARRKGRKKGPERVEGKKNAPKTEGGYNKLEKKVKKEPSTSF